MGAWSSSAVAMNDFLVGEKIQLISSEIDRKFENENSKSEPREKDFFFG
jgi:hypothetical protein